MKKFIPYIIILILVILQIRNCDNKIPSYIPSEIKTETIYSQKPWVPQKPFEIIQNPNTLIFFKGIKDTSRIYSEVKIEKDSILLYTDEFTKLQISKDYLLLYPKNDKLVSFDLSNSELQLNLLNINGELFQKNYQLDLNSYRYRYTDNILSVKENSGTNSILKKIRPDINYQFRPINNFHDLTLSLKFKTTKINYELGFNSSYYPSLSKKVNKDLIIGLSYNF